MDKQNLFSPEVIPNPFPLYQRLREESPIYWSEGGFWIVTRYDDVKRVLRDPVFGRQVDSVSGTDWTGGRDQDPLVAMHKKWMIFMDPPAHTRFRKILSRAFSSRSIERLLPYANKISNQLLDRSDKYGVLDVVKDFAYPLTMSVISRMIGIPHEDISLFRKWSLDLVRTIELEKS